MSMDPLFLLRDCVSKALYHKKIFILTVIAFFLFAILGVCFYKTPSTYGYILRICNRFIDYICFSDRSVVVIFFERTFGHLLILALILVSGVHWGMLPLPICALLYRAYSFGGMIAIMIATYRLSGVLIVFVLYLPIHLLLDVVFLIALNITCWRVKEFAFRRDDFQVLCCDFLSLGAIIAVVCLLEAVILLVLFHSIGIVISCVYPVIKGSILMS